MRREQLGARESDAVAGEGERGAWEAGEQPPF